MTGIYIESSIYLADWSTAATLTEAHSALLRLDPQKGEAEIARIKTVVRSPSTHHLALFGYSDLPVSNDFRIQCAEAGLLNLFVYPELDDYVISHLTKTFPVTQAGSFPRFDSDTQYKVFMYDDSSAVLGRLNQVCRRAGLKPSGRTYYDQFEKDAPGVDADLYLVDLIHSETCIGIQLIEDLRKSVKGAIVAHSRMCDPYIKVACLNAGAYGYIEKSNNDDYLLARLKTYAAIGHHMREAVET